MRREGPEERARATSPRIAQSTPPANRPRCSADRPGKSNAPAARNGLRARARCVGHPSPISSRRTPAGPRKGNSFTSGKRAEVLIVTRRKSTRISCLRLTREEGPRRTEASYVRRKNSWKKSSCLQVLCRKGPELLRRPRPKRVRRQGLAVGPAGLDCSLLRLQLAASLEGTQLSAECPRQGPRSSKPHPGCQRHADRQSPAWVNTDGKNHQVPSDYNTPSDGDWLSVVLLLTHSPYRKAPTPENRPGSPPRRTALTRSASRRWDVGVTCPGAGNWRHRARGLEATAENGARSS